MSDIDIKQVVTPSVSMFDADDHVICCFDLNTTLCGLRKENQTPWEDHDITDDVGCRACSALYGTGFCPHDMNCDVWISIRDEQSATAKER